MKAFFFINCSRNNQPIWLALVGKSGNDLTWIRPQQQVQRCSPTLTGNRQGGSPERRTGRRSRRFTGHRIAHGYSSLSAWRRPAVIAQVLEMPRAFRGGD